MEAESGLAGVFDGLRLRFLVERALLDSSGCGEDEELAVGEHAVDVEQEEFDFAGAGGGGEFWHSGDSSIWAKRVSGAREPQDGKAPSELFEVAIRCNQCCLL